MVSTRSVREYTESNTKNGTGLLHRAQDGAERWSLNGPLGAYPQSMRASWAGGRQLVSGSGTRSSEEPSGKSCR